MIGCYYPVIMHLLWTAAVVAVASTIAAAALGFLLAVRRGPPDYTPYDDW